ncbi:MAG TPA: glycosyltransferase [Thermoanaerobaculia bacterium]|nr:glycosyltransferase [Thermoanaerobaculia bacterium]
MTFTTVLLALAVIGAVLTTVQTGLVVRLLGKKRPFAPGRREPAASASRPAAFTTTSPRVSILKPLSGLDDGLEENLASFARLTDVSYEVVLSAESEDDPAVPAARRVMARFPDAPFRLVVGGGTGVALSNPKVQRLVAAARAARGDIFFVSDSNVRVEPGDIAATVSVFDDPAVGCVSNVFTGSGARSFGAAIESLHLLTFVLPGTVLAASGGVACVVGKSMALTRAAHDAIGGFAAFTHVLAEDQAIGCAVKAAGFRIALSTVVVRNVTVARSLGRALNRQARWGKIRYSFSKLTYTGELLLNPLPFSLLACGGAALGPSGLPPLPFAAAGAILLLRLAQGFVLARTTRADLTPAQLLLLPVKDFFQLATQVVPYVSREVDWHGHRARLGPGTLLMPSRHVLPAAA